MRLRISHKLTLALAALLLDRVAAILEPATQLAAEMAEFEAEEAHQAQATAEATYRAATMAVAANASSAPGQPAS
jgi:hypothetical protein